MKTIKKLLVLLLTVLLINVMVIPSFASVSPAETEVNKGEAVTVTFTYENIAGIRGTFSVTGDTDILETVEFEAGPGFEGTYNSNEGIIAYFAAEPSTFVCTLKFFISNNAATGDKIDIRFEYESTVDGRLPSVPSYSYDYATIEIVLNFDELNSQIDAAKALNAEDYTTDSWNALADALADALAALNATTQDQVDAAAKALANAIAGLVQKPGVVVDYDELNQLIATAQGLDASDYTTDSWNALAEALTDAIAALNATTQVEVNAAAKALKDAIAALVEKPPVVAVDYSALEDQIEAAQALNKDDYTADSWGALEEALADANAALNATTQAEVDAAAKALKDAIAGLVQKPGVVVDYSALEEQIKIAQKLNKNDYTADSWNALADALAKAKTALSATTQVEVNAAAKALKDAIAGLVKKPSVVISYTELNNQIEAAQKLNKDDYTAESWAVLSKALKEAIEARKLQAQPAIDAAATALKEAIAGLVKKPVASEVDYSKLKEQIDRANGLDKDNYTEESWARVQTALDKANKLMNTGSQAEVDTATIELKTAIDSLETKTADQKDFGPILWIIILCIIILLIIILILIKKKKKKEE